MRYSIPPALLPPPPLLPEIVESIEADDPIRDWRISLRTEILFTADNVEFDTTVAVAADATTLGISVGDAIVDGDADDAKLSITHTQRSNGQFTRAQSTEPF